MIDKEKLLKEISCSGTRNIGMNCADCKHSNDREKTSGECIVRIIKNFPEEPAIDFDAILKEFDAMCESGHCQECKYYKIGRSVHACTIEFLKSKNLTQPQVDIDALRNEVYASMQKQREIPVKRTGILKSPSDVLPSATWIEFKGCKKALVDDNDNIGKRCELEYPEFCYTDIGEEIDYSAIPKGSIVELKDITGVIHYKKVIRFENNLLITHDNGRWDISKIIRVVERAKI